MLTLYRTTAKKYIRVAMRLGELFLNGRCEISATGAEL
ncbi:hypothetical protein OQ483_09570 [Enterobacter bugandensis]|nr:hypothetical protein [Enterobacter bugandensis]WMU74621.1 hypothetical protein OQ483_09570 [Enterobacter bugandensis]